MTGRSLLNLLAGRADVARDKVFLERERHANTRRGDLSYPCRAVRTKQLLYIRNLRPELMPAGLHFDVDGSPSKSLLIDRCDDPQIAPIFKLTFGKRPGEELFDLSTDPDQVSNVAGEAKYAGVQSRLRADLDRWMAQTADPRAKGETDRWDEKCPYTGRKTRRKPKK